jgi:hypothetical protein
VASSTATTSGRPCLSEGLAGVEGEGEAPVVVAFPRVVSIRGPRIVEDAAAYAAVARRIAEGQPYVSRAVAVEPAGHLAAEEATATEREEPKGHEGQGAHGITPRG